MISHQCKDCFLKTYQRLFEKNNISSSREGEFWQFFDQTIKSSVALTAPEVQRELSQKLSELTGISDFFTTEKATSNQIALSLYHDWKERIQESKNPFDLALRLSIAGNIIDFGANHDFDLLSTIRRVIYAKFAIDHSKQLKERIQQANKIIYLGDNTGEIVFDKLFIEVLNHPNIVYVVRGGNALNDATMQDALSVGINTVARVIENGFNAPSTILEKCSPEFLELYNSADVVISKGQGNLEGLIQEQDPRIFFLLMVKCDVMAKLLNVQKGSFLVYNPNLN